MVDENRTITQESRLANIEKAAHVTFKYGDREIKKILGAVPISPELFIGREGVLEDIHGKLSGKCNTLLLVNGEGGIGKTTVAASYYHHYFERYSHLIWVFAETSIEDAILLLALHLKLKIDGTLSNQQKIEEVLRELSILKTPSLLVIDNANDLSSLQKTHPLFLKCSNLHLLITTRDVSVSNAEIYHVAHLSKTDAREFFTRSCKSHEPCDDDLLGAILGAVGYNALVIELLAKSLNNFNMVLSKKYSLRDLLTDLQNTGVLELKKSDATMLNLQTSTPEAVVAALYDISKLNEEEKAVLSVLSVLPSAAIPFEHLKLFYRSSCASDKLTLSLAHKGWINFDKGGKKIKCNPVVQEIVRRANHDKLPEYCWDLINSLNDYLDYETGTGTLVNTSYDTAVTYINYSESICRCLKRHTIRNISVLIERIGTFYFTYGDLDKALKYYEDDSSISKELYESDPHNIDFKNNFAISFEKLGNTHTALGDLDKALKYYEDEATLFQELHKSNRQNVGLKNGLAISFEKLGNTHTLLGNLKKALKYHEEYATLTKELYESNPHNIRFKSGLAISYEKLGNTHTALGNLEKALKYHEEYATLTKELYESNPHNIQFKNGLAISYTKLGETHAITGNLEKALKYYEDETALFQELNNSDQHNVRFKNGLAISYEKLGETHTALGNLEKALKYYEEETTLFQELYTSNPHNIRFKNGLAISYEKLGETHTIAGNLEKALKYYEEDLTLTKELYELNPHNVGFTNGLAISYEKLGETHTALGNLEKALKYYEDEATLFQELSTSNPHNIRFKNGLAISYSKLGETHAALGNLGKALKYYKDETLLFQELYESNPHDVRFQNGLAISYSKMGVFFRDSKTETANAVTLLKKAKKIWEILARDFPSHVEFRKNLAWVNGVLKNV